MKSIWKFDLPDDYEEFSIEMPIGAEVLSVQVQHRAPKIWATVDPFAEKERRHFQVIGTGWSVKSFDGLRFVGTFQLHGGEIVFHLFEVIK